MTHTRLYKSASMALALGLCAGTLQAAPAVEYLATPVAAMTAPRASHTATLLADGTVLVTGGCARDGCDGRHASAERFDPATGRFQRIAGMANQRTSHTGTLLADGRVLIAGGWSLDTVTASAELYDPASGRFLPAGSMTEARAAHTATLLADGRVLLVGGERTTQSAISSAEVFDPVTGTFSAVMSMFEPRIGHRAERLLDGRVLVVGGRAGRERPLGSTEVFDPVTGQFGSGPRLTAPRHKFAMTRLADGRVLVVAGTDQDAPRARHASTEVYDPARNAFAAGPALPEPRYKIPSALVVLPTGEALLAGGGDTALLIDVTGRRVRQVMGSIVGAQSFSVATPLNDGRVLVTGGYDEALKLTAGAWIIAPR